MRETEHTTAQPNSRRHIGGSILPSSDPAILRPIETEFGRLQVRALPDLDTHALFLTHDRGECSLVMHANGYSCHEVAKRMAAKDAAKVRDQVQHILACGGLSMHIDSILSWLHPQVDPNTDTQKCK